VKIVKCIPGDTHFHNPDTGLCECQTAFKPYTVSITVPTTPGLYEALWGSLHGNQ